MEKVYVITRTRTFTDSHKPTPWSAPVPTKSFDHTVVDVFTTAEAAQAAADSYTDRHEPGVRYIIFARNLNK